MNGNFYFRFLKTMGQYTVWMDLNEENTVIPLTSGTIFVKVSRVVNSGGTTPTTSIKVESTFESPSQSNMPPPSIQKPPKPVPTLQKKESEKLISFNDSIDDSHQSNGTYYILCIFLQLMCLYTFLFSTICCF